MTRHETRTVRAAAIWGGLGLAIVLVAAACASTPVPTPSSAQSTAPAVTATASLATPGSPVPTVAVSPTATPRPAWQAFTTTGYLNNLVVGPDGTLYLAAGGPSNAAAVVALDPAGQARPGWPYKPSDANVFAINLAPDGTVYVVSGGNSTAGAGHLVALGPAGQPRPGWPVVLKSAPFSLTFGSDGTTYFAGSAGGGTDDHLYALDAAGRPKPGWPVAVPGVNGSLVLAADGSVYIGAATFTSTSITSRIYAFGPDGKPKPGWPLPRTDLQSPMVASDGTLYAQSNQQSGKVYAFAPDGKPKPGWKVATLPGFVSETATGLAGSVYVAVSLGNPAYHSVLELDSTGAPKAGWKPYTLPRGMYLYPLVVGPSGVLYVPLAKAAANNSSVPGPDVALGPSGLPLPAWPKDVIDSLGGPKLGPDGTAYVASGSQVYAFAPDGTAVSGWPYRLPAAYTYANITIGPDGTVYVVGGGKAGATVVALTPAGKPVGQQ